MDRTTRRRGAIRMMCPGISRMAEGTHYFYWQDDWQVRPAEALEWKPEDYFRRARLEEIFPQRVGAPLEIDLGCGDGGFLLAMAERYPERNFLGVERLLGRIRKVSRKARRKGIENVRLLRLECAYAVEWLLPPGCAMRVHLLCPDPWPKQRHHRRRLVQTTFLKSVHGLLEDGGEFLFKTDHPDYAEWVEEKVEMVGGFERLPWEEGDFFYPQSDFEKQWLAQGKTLHRLRLARR